MIYIGNYKEWIDNTGIIKHLDLHDGDTRPVYQPDRWKGDPALDAAFAIQRPAYQHTNHVFQQFNINSADMKDFPIEMPTLPDYEAGRNRSWWFIKLLPGQFQPMHFDPHLVEVKNPVRYSFFLQDWIPGHIYTWADGKTIANYKAGDMYRWSDAMCYHGCANIGFENRYTFQITTHGSPIA